MFIDSVYFGHWVLLDFETFFERLMLDDVEDAEEEMQKREATSK